MEKGKKTNFSVTVDAALVDAVREHVAANPGTTINDVVEEALRLWNRGPWFRKQKWPPPNLNPPRWGHK